VAQSSAGPAQIVRGNVFKVALVASVADHVPYHILANARAPYCSHPANRSEDSTVRDAGCRGPTVDCVFDPLRHGDRADVAAFANQVNDGPVSLTGLDVIDFQGGKFGAAQSAADQDGDHGAISLGPQITAHDSVQDRRALFQG